MEFRCIDECAQCCIEREYYPSKEFGKIGVLILPEEKDRIENIAKNKKIEINILPRIGISNKDEDSPSKILAYQMMGKDSNGNTCPFLDTNNENKSPHGGYPCSIYDERPLACMTYPLIETNPITLDEKCKFCKEHKTADENLDSEIEGLLQIKEKMNTDATTIWRFATQIGEKEDQECFEKGWILEK